MLVKVIKQTSTIEGNNDQNFGESESRFLQMVL
jgi:hypothetical protein